jgi:hypothetical protein
MNLCLKACPMRSRSSLENLPSGYVRLTKSPQMRSMSSSLMLWSSAMGSGQSGSGCRNASAMPSTSVRPSRWEIHRRATRGSVRCGGRAASHSDVGMPSARHCGVVMLLVGVENSWPRDPKRLVCGWSWVMPRRRLRAQISYSHVTIPSPQLAPPCVGMPVCPYSLALGTRYVLGMHLTLTRTHSTHINSVLVRHPEATC